MQPTCTNFDICVRHTVRKDITKSGGLSPLGGANIIQNLYLINRCSYWHEILHISSGWHCESMLQNWWTFATADGLGGAMKMKFLFHPRLHQTYLNELVWGILSHRLQFHSVSSQDLEDEKLWKAFWLVFPFGRDSQNNFKNHIWTSIESRNISPALQIVREEWNSVHLYILTRQTKKSLGAMI